MSVVPLLHCEVTARSLLFALALCGGARPCLAADSIGIPNSSFTETPGEEGADWQLTGGAWLHQAPLPFAEALVLEPGSVLEIPVHLPQAPEKPDIAPQGWYAVASVEVLGILGGERGELVLSLRSDESSSHAIVTTPAPLRENGLEEPATGETQASASRLWLRIPPKALMQAAVDPLQLVLQVKGAASVVVDDLRFERFHTSPKRSLLGKSNGFNGPDLIGAGLLGFGALTEHGCTSFSILEVRAQGPAARAGLVAGDLVVAIDGRPLPQSSLAPGWDWFRLSNEARLGRSIEAALEAGRPRVTLGLLRSDGLRDIEVKLPLKGSLRDGFPLGGKLGQRWRDDLIEWTVAHQLENGSWPGTRAVNPALGGLALLGTRDPRHKRRIKRCVKFLLAANPHPREMGGLAYWAVAFHGIFFAEYYLASGDERVLEWMREASSWLIETTHECKWGMQAFGHGPDGLPYDNKALMAPAAHLLVYDALARKCGVESRIWEHIEDFVVHSWSDPASGGHGAMGYNAASKDKTQFWSRSGLTALAATLRGETGAMRHSLCLIMAERHPWMLNSHAYGEPGAALGLLGLALAQRPSFDSVMPKWRWRFLSSWEPGFGLRYSTPHMGAPYMGQESIVNLAYAVLCAVENRGLVVAGGQPKRWLR